jgi:hypothetical protein
MSGGNRRTARTVLEHLLIGQDRTYEEAAREFIALARRLGETATITPRHLGRLARGERSGAGTTPATRRVLQAMFGQPVDALLCPWAPPATGDTAGLRLPAPPDGGRLAEPHDGGASGPPHGGTHRPHGGAYRPHGDTYRSTGGGTHGPHGGREHERNALSMVVQRVRQFAALAGQDNAPGEVVEQLRDDVQRLSVDYPRRPVWELLADLTELQENLFGLLERRQRPERSRQLYFLAGVTCGLLAKASHDLADPHAAMAMARTGFLCADNADHDGLRGWLRGLQSLVAYWAGRPQESVRYAQSGAEHATRSGSTTTVWLAANEARGWAALGNAERTRAAVDRASAAWDSVVPDDLDSLGGLCTFNRSRALYYAADALAWLPDATGPATRYAEQAVAAYADPGAAHWAFGDAAGSRANLAIARLAEGELDGAAEALAPVLELPAEQRINGVVHSVARVGTAITRTGLIVPARELRDQIELFARTSLRALPL